MRPKKLEKLMQERGQLERWTKGQIFHSQDFADTMYMLKTGYAKRYQVARGYNRAIELIYGPGEIFPLSQLYRRVFSLEQNQRHLVYVYQAVTDVEIWRIDDTVIEEALKDDQDIFVDLYYESGVRLKSNIDSLANHALKEDQQKVAHRLFCIADDFGKIKKSGGIEEVEIQVPLETIDIAEFTNISETAAKESLDYLEAQGVIKHKNGKFTICNIDQLKDLYLAQ